MACLRQGIAKDADSQRPQVLSDAAAVMLAQGLSPHPYPTSSTMKNKLQLEFEDVRAIAAAAEAEAVRNAWAVSIAIVDDGGHLLHFQRLDGAAVVSSAAAAGRRDSKVYEDMINGGRYSFLSAPMLQGMMEGGVPIMKDGQCLGAVGVSGVKSHEDAQVAKAGIAALG
jgi:uncharacterized protein GlcG (DUF336 family)